MTMASGVGRVVRRGEGGADGITAYDLMFESIRQFQSDFAPMISTEGLFIETDEPLETSAVLRFRVVLPDDFVLIEGTGVVVWSRVAEDTGPPPLGMAIRFATLNERSRELIEKVVDAHVRDGGREFDVDSADAVGSAPLRQDPPEARPAARAPKATAAEQEAIRFSVRGAAAAPKGDGRAAGPDAATGSQPPPKTPKSAPPPKTDLRPPLPTEPVVPEPPAAPPELPGSSGAPFVIDEPREEWAAEPDEVTASELDLSARVQSAEERAAGHDFYAQLAARDSEDQSGGELHDELEAEELSLDSAVDEASPDGESASEFAAEDPPAASGRADQDELVFDEPVESPLRLDEPTQVEAPSASVHDADDSFGAAPAADLEEEGRQIAASFKLPRDPAIADAGGGSRPALGTERTVARPDDHGPWGAPRNTAPDLAPRAGAAAGGAGFEMSLFGKDEDDEDPTPSMEGLQEMADISVEEMEKRRSPWLGIALAICALAAVVAGVVYGPGLYEQVLGGGAVSGEMDQVAAPAATGDSAGNELVGGGEAVTTGVADGEAEIDQEAVPEISATAAEAAPSPTPAPVKRVAPGPASEVVDIGFEAGVGRTTVVIVGNAAVHEEWVSTFPMDNPPRVLVRLRKITAGFSRETIAVRSDEISQIRIGHHPEQRPPALYVVLDLADEGATVVDSTVDGEVLRVTIGR